MMDQEREYTPYFIDSVYEFVEEYSESINISKDIDGKFFINFEDFFRYLTVFYPKLYDDETVYYRLKEFMFSNYNTKVKLLDKENGIDHNIYSVRNNIEYKLVISKHTRFSCLDISASVTILKLYGERIIRILLLK